LEKLSHGDGRFQELLDEGRELLNVDLLLGSEELLDGLE
jgi:hypothetical protein